MTSLNADAAAPPIGRRPVPPVTGALPSEPIPESSLIAGASSLLSARPGQSAVRLLVGSHLLLLVQPLLVLSSPADLGGARGGIAAICAVSFAALCWAIAGHFRKATRRTGRTHHGA